MTMEPTINGRVRLPVVGAAPQRNEVVDVEAELRAWEEAER